MPADIASRYAEHFGGLREVLLRHDRGEYAHGSQVVHRSTLAQGAIVWRPILIIRWRAFRSDGIIRSIRKRAKSISRAYSYRRTGIHFGGIGSSFRRPPLFSRTARRHATAS